jgi:hypothetical protein
MKNLMCSITRLTAAALLCVASASPSNAATTLYVSGGGNDANACTLAQPCRTIDHALGAAGAGGTVSCLDAGPYTEDSRNNNNTQASFTLDCRGVVYAAAGVGAFFVGGPNVVFRNITFDGAAGGNGAVFIVSGNVVFEHCTFQNFTGNAVTANPTSAGAHLTITDSVFAHNGAAAGGGGIIIYPSGGITMGVVIERTQVTDNTYGIYVSGQYGGTSLVEVRYSTIANNTFDGINVASYAQGVESVVVEHSASVQNGGNGVYVQGANAYASLKDSTVDWNATGLRTGLGGTILSYGNNVIAGNTSAGVTPVSVGQQ